MIRRRDRGTIRRHAARAAPLRPECETAPRRICEAWRVL